MDGKTKAETDLETRLTQLSLAVKRAESIIESGKRVAIKRHLQALQTTAKEASQCKLVITKFDGSCMNWPKFWGQFSEAIDKSSVAPITKFTYLLELLEPQEKRCVEALPFNPEGYNRAKAILQDKYGKESEIIKCYMKEILDLPNVTGTNPRKIAEFHDKLSHSVQALETMKKLHEINGNVSMTDPEWESWDFVQLVQALRQWVKRNPVVPNDKEREENTRRKLFNTRGEDVRVKGCVYCGDTGHKAMQCEKVVETSER